MFRFLFFFCLKMILALPLVADPKPYALDLQSSKVVFFYELAGQSAKGVFPVRSATTLVDLKDVRRSSLDVVISTKGVRVANPLVAVALPGADLLHTARYPEARFVSSRVLARADGVRIEGELTLKGIRRPVSLQAVFQRRADAPEDNSELILRVIGDVRRSDFGIKGYADVVADTIRLDFVVVLERE